MNTLNELSETIREVINVWRKVQKENYRGGHIEVIQRDRVTTREYIRAEVMKVAISISLTEFTRLGGNDSKDLITATEINETNATLTLDFTKPIREDNRTYICKHTLYRRIEHWYVP